MASRCGKAPPQSFLELASPKTAARTRSRTRAGARVQAARALPTALDAVSQLASTVNNQAGNPDRLNTSAHCLCFFQVELQREQLQFQREQASSSGQARFAV